MDNMAELRSLSEERFFTNWEDFVASERVAASEDSIHRLIVDLINLGPDASEEATRAAVDACVNRFNELDDEGWICTNEREDISEQVGRIIDSCGFEYDDDWLSERDW